MGGVASTAGGGTVGAIAAKAAATAKAAVATKLGLGVVTVVLVTAGGVWIATHPSPPALPAPVAHWKFDEGSGSTAGDSSGNGNHGTLKGGVTWVKDSKLGAACSLRRQYRLRRHRPARDSTLPAPSRLPPGSGPSVGADNVIVGKGFTGAITPFWLALMGPTQALRPFRQRLPHGGSGSSVRQLHGRRWHHLAGVCDGAAYRLYIDGKQAASTADRVGISTGPNTVEIGRINEHGGIKHFTGLIGDVNIFREPLTDAQVAVLAQPK